jgi:hypothetical protein
MAMNRREFIGAGAMTASAVALPRSVAQVASATAAPADQGSWLRKGLIDGGGTHEPYIFVVRRGGQRLDARKTSEAEESEALILQLQQQGVEVFHTHLYKGFGMEAEMPGMEATKKAAAIAHRLGMKTDTYVQWNTMMYETFFAEEPRATNWIQRDIAGLPILLPYGYQQSFRYRPCFSNQEYLEYLKRVVRYAVVEVKTDFIHFDNFDLNAEPDSCHCSWCVNGFRKRLKQKYTDEERRERFGFVNTDYVNPPQWNRGDPPEKMQIIFDPAFQEWIDFRCQVMADALEQIAAYMKSLNPEVAVEINCGGITGANRSWENGIDHARLLKHTQVMWSEENDDQPPHFAPDGRLVSKIRSFKLTRMYKNTLLVPIDASSVAMGEALAFNQTLGFVGSNPLSGEMQRYIAFYKRNRDLYLDSADIAPVAVLRSYASLTNNNARCQLSAILTEQALIQSRIPFALIFDEHLKDLSAHKVVILPNSECLSDEQLSLLRRYVNAGGGLVVTEQAGLYDQWRRARVEPGLAGLVDDQAAGSDYQEEVAAPVAAAAGAVSRKQSGSGRVAYLPALQFAGALPPPQAYFGITSEFWKRPQNWKDLVDAVAWAGGGKVSFAVEGPEFLAANYTSQPGKRRVLVHLVNYDAVKTPALSSLQATIAIPRGETAKKATLYAPDAENPQSLQFHSDGANASVVVPEMRSYAMVAIEY